NFVVARAGEADGGRPEAAADCQANHQQGHYPQQTAIHPTAAPTSAGLAKIFPHNKRHIEQPVTIGMEIRRRTAGARHHISLTSSAGSENLTQSAKFSQINAERSSSITRCEMVERSQRLRSQHSRKRLCSSDEPRWRVDPALGGQPRLTPN